MTDTVHTESEEPIWRRRTRNGLRYFRLSAVCCLVIPIGILLLALPTIIGSIQHGATEAGNDWLSTLWYPLMISALVGGVLEVRARRKA